MFRMTAYMRHITTENPPARMRARVKTASLYVQGEDCLYLNIWKADDARTEKKPVMVWIHGGAFEMGGTVDPLYNCHKLAEEHPDVIFASIEYRVGPFGFLHLSHLPDGQDYPDAQNLGLMDQLMALKWINENIAAFGGDPDKVFLHLISREDNGKKETGTYFSSSSL